MAGNNGTGGGVAEWEDYDEGSAAQEAEKMEAEDKSDSRYFKLVEGRNPIRILPPPKGVASPFMVTYQHFIDLPAGKSIQFQCPAKMAETGTTAACPACLRSDKLKRSGSQQDRDIGFDIAAKRRVFVNVIDRKNETKGPQVLGLGKGIHEDLLKLRRDPDAGGNYTHPISGYDIVIERTGTGKNDTKYTVRMANKATPLGNMEWIGEQQNLGELLQIPTADQISAMLRGETKQKNNERRSAGNQPSSNVEDDMTTPATGGWGAKKKDDVPF